MKGTIYKYTFPDGKVYIGQTVRPLEARHREHTTPSTGKLNPAFWKAWEKFGTAKLDVLEEIDDSDDNLVPLLNIAEAHYIMMYQSTNPEFGYNRISHSFVQGTKSRLLKQEHDRLFYKIWEDREPFFITLLGKVLSTGLDGPLSEEEKEYIREVAFQYLPFGPEGIDIDNLENLVCNNDEEPLEQLSFAIQQSREEEMSLLSSMIWDFIHENEVEICDKKVIQKISKGGEVIKEYSGINEIMHDLNLSRPTNIYHALEGKQKTAYGYIWRYKSDGIKDEVLSANSEGEC